MKVLDDMVNWLRARYDRMLALLVFAALLGSLLYLAVRIGRLQRDEEAFQRRIDGLRPMHPSTAALDAAPFERASEMVRHPPQIANWTNALTVPEIRVWCVDCRQPIPFAAESCPACLAPQPPMEDWSRDSDRDGIPDLAEQELKLDPLNPADAKEDSDGDLFTNLDEYREKTDLRNPLDYPPVEKLLRLEKVEAVPFSLLFKSYMKGAKGVTFQINTRKGGRTHFVKIGDEVDGFVLQSFTLNVTTGATAVAGGREDRSELSLRKSGRAITLVVGQDQQYDEYTCHFRFRLTDQAIVCKVGERFDLRPGRSYEALRVDNASSTVVVRRVSDGMEFSVGPKGASGDN